MKAFYTARAMLPAGWARNVRIQVTAEGIIHDVQADTTPQDAEMLSGPVVPGMPNLHSHAFQRAMAGLAEVMGDPEDSFWTWRDLMYRMVGKISPHHLQVIAKQLYIEMLKGGYTSVAEFHYLHHDPAGSPYADVAEMGLRIATAAEEAGIGLTLLPVLYSYSGFGARQPTDGQCRFINDTERYLRIQNELKSRLETRGHVVGTCFHSLRATGAAQLHDVLAHARTMEPVHIHIAEQTKEVEDCLSWSGQRPIEWLFNNIPVDERWCLIHATHANPHEVSSMVASKAVVGLCPTTEANLGDGIFPAVDFLQAKGRFGVGTDSHVSLNVLEELRWLEYGQRLRDQRRNRLYTANAERIGNAIYNEALKGGAQALGQKVGRIEAGYQADWLVLDGEDPYLSTAADCDLLNRWLFAGRDNQILHVMVRGKWVVMNGHHPAEESSRRRFAEVLKVLL